jgi:16S rRNA (uracil1498-N3)-methyltransferase
MRRRFFVNDVHAGRAQILGADAHHLTRVLRVQPGQKFEISDNRNLYLAEIEIARKDLVSFTVIEPLAPAESAVSVSLFASLIKFERFEWLLEKATELGVETITPVTAERSEKGLERAAVKRLERWRKIAREASEQSRRLRLPEVNPPMLLTGTAAVSAQRRYVLDEHPVAPPILTEIPVDRSPQDRVALLVGPEGGWTESERALLARSGWTPAGLGSTILRAETAAIAAIAIINAAWHTASR